MEEGIKLPAEGATMSCKASGHVLQSLSLLCMMGFCRLAGLGGWVGGWVCGGVCVWMGVCVWVCVCVCVRV